MSWYLRTIRGGTDGVPYEPQDLAIEQVSPPGAQSAWARAQVVKEGGRASYYATDGSLIDSVRIEDEEGREIPIAL